MESLNHFGPVRIGQLLRPIADYDGWHINQRPPRSGDVGVCLDILRAPGLPNLYVVESFGPDGETVWLADFVAEELEPVAQFG